MKKRMKFHKMPLFLLITAVILLLASTVGSTQAALTYYSDNFMAEVTVSNIGVTLLENGKDVSHRNYIDDNRWDDTKQGRLLENLLAEGEKFQPGKRYEETISVRNSGAIDAYVRVILRKSWSDEQGNKTTKLSPALISLGITKNSGWVVDEKATTEEQIVLYYSSIVPSEGETPVCVDSISVDDSILDQVIKTEKDGVITYTYAYNGYSFQLEAEVQAVQTHNAEDAIKSAWGRDVSVDEAGQLQLM